MPVRDIVVIGASFGGVSALRRLVAKVPANLPASLFVVLHTSPAGTSLLDKILSSSGPLKAHFAQDGERIEKGRLYIAPPDHHLLLSEKGVRVSHGPKENLHRPAVNPLFRSAAQAFGERVVGIVLTGLLDDGAAGLWEIKQRGGVGIVQDPDEAEAPSMPISALEVEDVDYSLRVADIGPMLAKLAAGSEQTRLSSQDDLTMESKVTDITCPECRGTLWESAIGPVKEFTCRVGHSYSSHTVLAAHLEAEEKALWAAAVALQEGAVLARRFAAGAQGATSQQLESIAAEKERQADIVREIVIHQAGLQFTIPANIQPVSGDGDFNQ